MSPQSEIGSLELIVLLNSTVFLGHFDTRIIILAQVVRKILSVADPLING